MVAQRRPPRVGGSQHEDLLWCEWDPEGPVWGAMGSAGLELGRQLVLAAFWVLLEHTCCEAGAGASPRGQRSAV